MSTLNHLFDSHDQNQLCYVQCGYCATLLLVTVPCSRLAAFVTVRCGHCTTVLGVNMMKAPIVPLQYLYASQEDEFPCSKESYMALGSKSEDWHQEAEKDADDQKTPRSPSPVTSSVYEEKEHNVNQVIKPPTKRQRTPSPYNCFIREEIHRLKKENPKLTHKQAFSTAAKNWAHFPTNKHKAGESQGGEES